MNELDPRTTFRGLPLTADQEREVEHYIHTRQRSGLAWDTPELRAMIADMLNPPELMDDDDQALGECMASENATALGEEPAEPDLLPSEHEQSSRRRP
jgi:hypothetical protein